MTFGLKLVDIAFSVFDRAQPASMEAQTADRIDWQFALASNPSFCLL
jgi:hypothetical protein